MNFLSQNKITQVKAPQATATTEIDSDSVDMAGFEGVTFVGSLGTANAGNYAKIQQSSDNGVADGWSDLADTKVVPGDNGDSFAIEVYHPEKRYLRAVVIRAGATTTTGDVYAIQSGAHKAPVDQGATIDSEIHASPAEGTA